jgi:thermostable 8-oxoguanine DNA glycosylase
LETKQKHTEYCRVQADEFFKTLPTEQIEGYKQYWQSVRPQNHGDIFRRYLFAYCSVHTSWQGNCRGYNAIKKYEEWIDNKESLLNKLKESRVGLHNNRTKYIWDFATQFWAKPSDFYLTTKKYHVKKRNDIVNKITGLGSAKVSFALEMIHPLKSRALCLDVHMLRLYGMQDLTYKSKSGFTKYRKAEQHWSVNCGKLKVPSYIARCMYWDKLQGQNDSRYWSYVLEDASLETLGVLN